jgi:alpha-beta hydrolase superfamily lysophospholipase
MTEALPLDPEPRQDRSEEVSIDSGGVPIVLSIWHAEPTRASVVFLAGTMVHPLFYAEFLAGLADHGYTVVGVHAQGHGKSPRTDAVLSWTALLRNAQDAAAYAVERFGHPTIVLGSSQGGMLAMALAATGAPVDGVIAHNILDPADPAALRVTRFPASLAAAHRQLRWLIRVAGRVLPRLPVPIGAYLDLRRVCGDDTSLHRFRTDALALHHYLLGFLADLFAADLSGMTDGRIHCPVTVLAASGDPLFPTVDARRLFDAIRAPHKRFVQLDLDRHLILNECVPQVLPTVAEELTLLITRSGATPDR